VIRRVVILVRVTRDADLEAGIPAEEIVLAGKDLGVSVAGDGLGQDPHRPGRDQVVLLIPGFFVVVGERVTGDAVLLDLGLASQAVIDKADIGRVAVGVVDAGHLAGVRVVSVCCDGVCVVPGPLAGIQLAVGRVGVGDGLARIVDLGFQQAGGWVVNPLGCLNVVSGIGLCFRIGKRRDIRPRRPSRVREVIRLLTAILWCTEGVHLRPTAIYFLLTA